MYVCCMLTRATLRTCFSAERVWMFQTLHHFQPPLIVMRATRLPSNSLISSEISSLKISTAIPRFADQHQVETPGFRL